MITSICSDSLTACQGQVVPLQAHIDWFAKRLAEQGYTHSTTKEKLRLVTHLSQWLEDRHLPPETLNEPDINQFLLDRQQQGRAPRHNRDTLQSFLTELRDAGLLPIPVRQESRLDVLERAFRHYLDNDRGLSLATQINYLPIVRGFLQERFGTGPLLLNTLGLHDVTQYLLRHTATLSPRHAQLLVSTLRTFSRFLVHRVTSPPTWLPPSPPWQLGVWRRCPKRLRPSRSRSCYRAVTKTIPPANAIMPSCSCWLVSACEQEKS